MISLSHVYKTYPGPVHALRDINLQIEKGEFVFLTGPSGAGKTTLFRILTAYDIPTTGSVIVDGQDISRMGRSHLPFFRRKIGVVFQDFRLLNDRTIFDNVSLPLIIRGENDATIRRRVMEVLEMVSLQSYAKTFPLSMSGGEQQRAAIARALVARPNLIIADEPTGNLDPDLTNTTIELLERACSQGTTVVVATHNFELVKRKNKRHLKIRAGEITIQDNSRDRNLGKDQEQGSAQTLKRTQFPDEASL